MVKTGKKRKTAVGARFIDNGDGTIKDTKSGLIWIKNPHTDLPEPFKSYMTWKDAIQACKDLSFAGKKDWRLPSVEELRELVDYTRAAGNDPAIDTTFFPDTKCPAYWTITPCAWGSGSAWCVLFSTGSVSPAYKDNVCSVRPVRSSQ